ncbi:MAG: hypothetical protein KAS32_20750, partial [Candidatus Peribacteraceae bacterium]|nr:hypothetical protein [Candidatus Peribacteraceae bacterium]
PQQDGWTMLYNFTTLINDTDSDYVNCTLYINKSDGNGWVYHGKDELYSASGILETNCSVEVQNFTGDDIGPNSFYFLIEDGESANDHNTSVVNYPYLEEPNTTVIHDSGDQETVNMSDGNSDYIQLLSVHVNDDDNSTDAPNVNVSFWLQYNTTDNATAVLNVTNSTGHAQYYFNPNCNWSAGNWEWISGVTDNYYQNTNASTFNITIKENIVAEIISPLGSEHERGTNVTIRFGLHDSCSRNITGMTDINITMTSALTSDVFNCTIILDEGNGVYNCTFNTSVNPGTMPSRGYRFEILSNKQYYNRDNETQTYTAGSSGFFIDTVPILQYPQLNTTDYDGDTGENGSWSEPRTFTINVTDEDGDQVTLKLWKRRWTGSAWTSWSEVSTQYPDDTNNTIIYFNENGNSTSPYTPPTDLGTWQYKFNATDDPTTPQAGGSTYADKINGTNYTVEKDDMTVYYSVGGGGTVWRNGTDTELLSARIWSIDQQRYLVQDEGNGMVWITKNGTDYVNVTDPADPPKSLTGGYVNNSLDPDCSYDIGLQYWKIGVFNNNNFKDTNITGTLSLYNITLNTNLSGTIITPWGQAVKRATGVNVEINFNISDECGNGVGTASSVTLDITGQQNYPIVAGITDEDNGSYFYNWSTTVPDKPLGVYNITATMDKTYYSTMNVTKVDAFILATGPELDYRTPPLIVSDDYGWGETFTFRMRCRDTENDVFNVSLWYRNNQSASWQHLETNPCSTTGTDWNYSVSFSTSYFNCSDITPFNDNSSYKFNATDGWDFTHELSPNNFTIIKDDVLVSYKHGSGGTIGREGANTELFMVEINDTDRSTIGVGAGISGIFNVTGDGSSYMTNYTNSTASDSMLRFNFNADCNHSYGQQKWIGGTFNDTCYKDVNLTEKTIVVQGQLYNNIEQPNWTNGQPFFNGTDQIFFRYNTTSDCSAEGAISSTDTRLYLQSPNTSIYQCTPVENETGGSAGYYNCTWDSSDQNEGNWTTHLNSSRQYFLDNETVLSDWFWLENLNATETDVAVAPERDGWTMLYNFTALINDTDSDYVNCTLFINKSDGNGFVYHGKDELYSASGILETNCSVEVQNFTGDDIGENSFYFLIQDGESANDHNTSVVN